MTVTIFYPTFLEYVVANRCVVSKLKGAVMNQDRVQFVTLARMNLPFVLNLCWKQEIFYFYSAFIFPSRIKSLETDDQDLASFINLHCLFGWGVSTTSMAIHLIVTVKSFLFLEFFEA